MQASPAAGEDLRQSLSARVKQLSANYIKQQQELLKTLLPAEDSSTAPGAAAAAADQAYDAAGLSGFCAALSDFDEVMNQVVVDAAVLKGVWVWVWGSEVKGCVGVILCQGRAGSSVSR